MCVVVVVVLVYVREREMAWCGMWCGDGGMCGCVSTKLEDNKDVDRKPDIATKENY